MSPVDAGRLGVQGHDRLPQRMLSMLRSRIMPCGIGLTYIRNQDRLFRKAVSRRHGAPVIIFHNLMSTVDARPIALAL